MKFIQTYVGRLILYFIILMMPLSVIGYMYYNSRVERYVITIKKEQEKEIELRIGRMVEYFRFVDSEMKTIVNQDQTIRFFNGKDREKATADRNLKAHFAELMIHTRMYDQIRLLDAMGMEKLRLNFENNQPQIVSEEDLRFKGDQEYFKEAIQLNKNEIFLSKFDLNQEDGHVQLPITPVLRIVSPVVDETNSKRGVLVFNLKGEVFMQSLREMGQESGWKVYMLNEEGYYLMGPDPSKEWAFQLSSDKGSQFKSEFPRIDRMMRSTDKATVSTSDGLFSFCMISEYNFSKVNVDVNVVSETWYIVSYLPNTQLRQEIKKLFDFNDLLLLVFAILFIALLSFVFANMVARRRQYEQKLIASGHDLRVANRMKDKFISILAHDLKNPLASITGFVDILKEDFLNMSVESRNTITTAMENSTKTLIRLIDDVLIWARSQNDASFKDPEIIFVNKIIDDAVKFSQMQASRKEVKLEIKIDDEYFALADPQMIETVLRNLISNAIKFSKRHERIEIGAKLNDASTIMVFVQDYGVGIKEKTCKNLFSLEGFQTTPGTENEKGTGMGLIICKDFVEQNNGTIWVESKENQGTTFKFTLLAYIE